MAREAGGVRVGIKFPTREIGDDPAVMREWASAATALGFDHICLIDHVLGADPEVWPDWDRQWPVDRSVRKAYTVDTPFHEAFVMMAYFAALAPLELSTGIMILPQRQTALFAKQAAEIDLLAGGKLRLVVAVGWNPVEYDALGQEFTRRGRRMDEQIRLLRLLWTQRTVDFKGEFDEVRGAGIQPLTVQRPIPLWIGGFSRRTLERVGRLGDGWLGGGDLDAASAGMEKIRQVAADAGRDGNAIGLEATLSMGYDGNPEDLEIRAERWRCVGATHLTVDTMGLGLRSTEHVAAMKRASDALGLAPR
jgi:probable F420-dependent oxidoreductase